MAGNSLVGVDPDEQFFTQYPDRQAHIRIPRMVPAIDKQRRVKMVEECQGEFWSLGEHDKSRRRILLWRVPHDRWHLIKNHDGKTVSIMKVPFLAYADEEIADRDDVLLPILDEVMKGAVSR